MQHAPFNQNLLLDLTIAIVMLITILLCLNLIFLQA
jgi:hypothetical protein